MRIYYSYSQILDRRPWQIFSHYSSRRPVLQKSFLFYRCTNRNLKSAEPPFQFVPTRFSLAHPMFRKRKKRSKLIDPQTFAKRPVDTSSHLPRKFLFRGPNSRPESLARFLEPNFRLNLLSLLSSALSFGSLEGLTSLYGGKDWI